MLRKFAEKYKKETIALWYAVKDPRTPSYVKVLGGAIVAYAISPIDLIPDFIPVLGYLDDLIIIPVGLALLFRLIPAEVLRDSREKATARIHEARPVSYGAAAVIIAIWIISIGTAVYYFGT